MKARADAARSSAGVLAACLMAWRRGEEDIDAQTGALLVAEVVLMVRGALKKG